ncbi:protein of unknown function [Nitrospira defluvii]|uniref:Uncharacterized protein n=1 Tax=Nitrospira defluvii TaxID=330214 RepID=D8P9L0_9BACT|nr:protein of unknown function [Nitrospira defluvii]
MAQNAAYRECLSPANIPNGQIFGLSRCQDNGFCLAQRRGVNQEDEPKRSEDMNALSTAAGRGERRYVGMCLYFRSRVVSR